MREPEPGRRAWCKLPAMHLTLRRLGGYALALAFSLPLSARASSPAPVPSKPKPAAAAAAKPAAAPFRFEGPLAPLQLALRGGREAEAIRLAQKLAPTLKPPSLREQA